LRDIILERLAATEAAMKRVAERAPTRVIEQRDRLRKAVTSLMEGALPNEERIAQEIAMLADRLDVAEEIARFASHVSAFRATLDAPPADGVGKRLPVKGVSAWPTIRPPSLIDVATLEAPPGSVPRSVMRPRSHKKACCAPSAVRAQPTTCPCTLTSVA
jgi:hypothetical protein